MSDYDMSIHSSTDAREWTDFFFKTYPNCNVELISNLKVKLSKIAICDNILRFKSIFDFLNLLIN